MLSKLELNIVEAVYLCYNYETINQEIKHKLIQIVYNLPNKEAFIYLKWLINRWNLIKGNRILPIKHIFKI
jgi:hypothetical protein